MNTEQETNAVRPVEQEIGSLRKKASKRRIGKRIGLLVTELVLLALVLGIYWGVNTFATLYNRIEKPTEEFFTIGEAQTRIETVAVTKVVQVESSEGVTEIQTEFETQVVVETPALPTIVVTDPEISSEIVVHVDVTKPTVNLIDEVVASRMKGFKTFVVFGVDARNNSTLLRLTQGDVCMIVSVNLDTKEVRIASVYRDSYLEGTTDYFSKLTDVYCNLGASMTMSALNRNYDLSISDFVVVNWKVVADVVNMLDGLDIEISEREAGAINEEVAGIIYATGLESTTIEEVAGVHHLDGVQTVAYARIRKIGNADYQRTERQRHVVELMLQKAKTRSLSEILKIVNVAVGEIATSMSAIEILDLAKDVFSYSIAETTGFPKYFKTNNYIFPTDLVSNAAYLHQFLYGTADFTPSTYLQQLNVLMTERMNAYLSTH